VQHGNSLRTSLRSHAQDPAVMAASLNALTEVATHDPRAYKNLVPSFVSILKQVSTHRRIK